MTNGGTVPSVVEFDERNPPPIDDEWYANGSSANDDDAFDNLALNFTDDERSLLGSFLVDGSRFHEADSVRVGHCLRPNYQLAWAAMVGLHDQGQEINYATIRSEIQAHLPADSELNVVALIRTLIDGCPKGANVAHFARRVVEAAANRNGLRQARAVVEAYKDRSPRVGDLIEQLTQINEVSKDLHERPTLEVLDMSNLADPACGEMEYLLPGSTPANTLITDGAEWKSGKTMYVYRKAIDAAMGIPVLGFYPPTDAIRVGILQLEMPPEEDRRRFRRLALGSGIEERHLPDLFNDRQIIVFNRPKVKIGGREVPFNLTQAASRDMLHEATEKYKIKFWIVDSVIRAFAGANLNDNSEVAGLLCLAYDPLTSAGCSVEQCHHKRKTGPDGKDDAKSSLLAAQAFGAGSGLILGLNSLPDRDEFLPAHGLHKFVNRLSVLGAWGPTDCSELAIGFYDEGPRTMCHTTSDMAQVAKSSKTRRCAWLASEIVRAKPGLNTTDLAARIVVRFPDEFHGDKAAPRTTKDGIKEAEAQEWIENRATGRGQESDYHTLPGAQMASP